MPVVAVAGIIGGASALAAGGLGVLGTIGAIGSIVGGIGALTGNKTLAKIGAIAGLAGGLGAFATGKGWMPQTSGMDTAAAAASDPGVIGGMINQPSGAEFSMGPPPNPFVSGTTPPNPFASGPGVMDMGDAIGASGASETMPGLAGDSGGGFAPTIDDSLGSGVPDISSTIGQQSSQIADVMGTEPAAPPGLMDSFSPMGENLADANPLVGGAGNDFLGGGGQDPLSNPTLSQTNDMFGPANNLTGMNTSGTQGGFQPPMPAGMGATPPNPFAQGATQKRGGILGLFDKFFRNPDGSLNNNTMSIASRFIGGMLDQGRKGEEDFLKARADHERAQAESERQRLAWGNQVPTMNFGLRRPPGGTFRPTAPTYQPVRIPGGLFNAR